MYPTISHLIYDVFGVNIPLPIQTFGLFVALAFVIGGWVIAKEIKRKEDEGIFHPIKKIYKIGEGLTTYEILSSSIGGFIIGFKLIEAIFNYDMLVANPQAFILSWQGSVWGGVMIAITSILFKWHEKNKTKLEVPRWEERQIPPHKMVGNMIMIAAISGIIGAKLFSNLEEWDSFINDPWGQLLSFSGLTFYGGLICGTIAVAYYARKNKINIIHLTDAFAPSLILAYGIGRIGCQLSGDGDWGIVNNNVKPEWMSFLPDWIWSYNYPHNVINEGVRIPNCEGNFCYQLAENVYPTPLYEIVMASIIFLVLWNIRKRIKIGGLLFCIYLTLNGVERFFIEKIRVNTKYDILGGITQAEIISFFLIIIGIIGYIILIRKKNNAQSNIS